MKRKTLDLVVSAGGVGIAALLVVLGSAMASEAAFAKEYVAEQLGEQRITFATTDALSDEEKNWKPGSSCLTANAGQPMVSGEQAACYANYYIAMHMRRSAGASGYGWENETYATMGAIQRTLRADIAAAKEAGDTAKAAELEEQLAAATSLRSTFQTGETLRGMLLTSFGFSVLGDKAQLASTVAFALAGIMALLSAAGLVHSLVTPASQYVGSHGAAAPSDRREQSEAA